MNDSLSALTEQGQGWFTEDGKSVPVEFRWEDDPSGSRAFRVRIGQGAWQTILVVTFGPGLKDHQP